MIRLKDLIKEAMTVDKAEEIFADFKVPNAASLDKDKLRQYYLALVKTHHPDRGGKVASMQDINSAYDVLQAAPPPEDNVAAGVAPGRTYPKDPKTKHMYTTKYTVQFRSVLSGKLLYQGKCDYIDLLAINRKLKENGVYFEAEGNVFYVDTKAFSRIIPDLTHFFTG